MNAVQETSNVHTHKLIGKTLWTLEKAIERLSPLNIKLANAESGDVVVVDCSGVDVFDVSFAAGYFDTAIASLSSGTKNICLVIDGLNSATRRNLSAALKESGLMTVERISDDEYHLVGRFSSSDEETLEFMQRQGEPLSARELSDALDIKITTANERLGKLAKMSILHKTAGHGGRTQQRFQFPNL